MYFVYLFIYIYFTPPNKMFDYLCDENGSCEGFSECRHNLSINCISIPETDKYYTGIHAFCWGWWQPSCQTYGPLHVHSCSQKLSEKWFNGPEHIKWPMSCSAKRWTVISFCCWYICILIIVIISWHIIIIHWPLWAWPPRPYQVMEKLKVLNYHYAIYSASNVFLGFFFAENYNYIEDFYL